MEVFTDKSIAFINTESKSLQGCDSDSAKRSAPQLDTSSNPNANTDSNNCSTFSSKREICWPMVLFYIHLHSFGLYGLYLTIFYANWSTVIFSKCFKSFLF